MCAGGERVSALAARLRKGARRTEEVLGRLNPALWDAIQYEGPPSWTVRDLLAHFASAEDGLLQVARDVAAGGRGAPDGFDYDAYNACEQSRLRDRSIAQLLADLAAARQATIAWVSGLEEQDLDRLGYHPALGQVTLETIVNAIYGHQLMHMRDLLQRYPWSDHA